MFGFFIGFIVFMYLVNRIGNLEIQSKKIRDELTSVESFLNSASPEDNKFIKENRQKDLANLRGEGYVPLNQNAHQSMPSSVTSSVSSSSMDFSTIGESASSESAPDTSNTGVHISPNAVPLTSMGNRPSFSEQITNGERSAKQSAEQTKEERIADQNAEFAVGSKVITFVGMVSVFFGVVAFLQYAFTNNIITPSMRVFLGILFGLVFIGVGHFLRKKYDTYATGLIGGGLGIFYISAYAAFSFYGLISEAAAFLFFLVITGFGILLSLLYNSKPLIQFSLLGGFIVPLIFPLAHSVHAIFPYLIILNFAILIIARFKVWPDLTALGLIATALLCIQWTLSSRADTAVTETFVYLTILFGIYFTTSFINFIVRDRDYKGVDAFLLYALPMLYFVWCSPLIETKEGFAILTFGLAMFYLIASIALRVIFMSFPSIKMASNVMIMIGSSFLAAATALHFDGSTVTIFWALEATLMVVTGYMLKARESRVVGVVLAFIVGFKSFMYDFNLPNDAVAIFNSRAFTVFFASLMFAVIWIIYKMIADERVEDDEKRAGALLGAVGLSLLPFIWLNAEVMRFVSGDAVRFLPIAWSLYALVFASLSFLVKETVFRVFAHIILLGSICIMIVTQWNLSSEQYAFIFNVRLLSAVVITAVLSAIAAMIHKHRDQLITDEASLLMFYYVGINASLLWALSLEVTDYYNAQIASAYNNGTGSVSGYSTRGSDSVVNTYENSKRVALSILWLGYASIALIIGIAHKVRFIRQFAIALLAITVFKIFLYDTANLSDIYRFVSFITLGIILLMVGFAYYRFKDRIVELVGVETKE
ncbi:MAG: DUF2339 domain-containing protein [Candidatus Pacebacteria bacterium]|nr:DUF2339 domain-containing protein [Candidatus Paceibacterota bacterium]